MLFQTLKEFPPRAMSKGSIVLELMDQRIPQASDTISNPMLITDSAILYRLPGSKESKFA